MDSNTCRVLVVEDEGLIAHDLATRLEALGHEVVGTVETAEEALEKAAGADIVLMDIRIDGPVDGVEAAARIRERYHLPVIFLTAHADRATLDRAKITGAFGYLVKPVAHASLNTAIEIAMYKHKIERKLEEREALLRTTLGSVVDAVVVTDHLSHILMMNTAAENLTGWTHTEAEGQLVLRVLGLVDGESGEPVEDPVPLAILKDAAVPLDRTWQLVSRRGLQTKIEGSTAPVEGVRHRAGDGAHVSRRQRPFVGRTSAPAGPKSRRGGSHGGAGLRRIHESAGEHPQPIRTSIAAEWESMHRRGRPSRKSENPAAAAEALTRRLTQVRHTAQATELPEVVSLTGMLRRMSRLIESVAGAQIEVAIRPSPEAGKVRVDAGQLEQRHGHEPGCCTLARGCATGGQLLIETGKTDLPRFDSVASYSTLNIAHTGQEPDLDKLFEPASIAEDGLALAMVHGIVTEHSGYISAQATSSGHRFRNAASTGRGDAAGGRGTIQHLHRYCWWITGKRVRGQLHNFFEAEGYNLLEAADDQEALALGEDAWKERSIWWSRRRRMRTGLARRCANITRGYRFCG